MGRIQFPITSLLCGDGGEAPGLFACNNLFLGNNLQGNVGNLGALFHATTGANILVGNENVVVDNGSFDCNGDGVPDPNIITGTGPLRRGVPFAAPTGGAAATRRGIEIR